MSCTRTKKHQRCEPDQKPILDVADVITAQDEKQESGRERELLWQYCAQAIGIDKP
jgi:hypothetical protein